MKHVIHTIQTSKHEESNLLIDRSQQVLCTMKLLLNLKSYPFFHGSTKRNFKKFYTGIWITASNWHVVALWGHNRFFIIYHYFCLFVHLILFQVAIIYTIRIECTRIYILRLEITKFVASKISESIAIRHPIVSIRYRPRPYRYVSVYRYIVPALTVTH